MNNRLKLIVILILDYLYISFIKTFIVIITSKYNCKVSEYYIGEKYNIIIKKFQFHKKEKINLIISNLKIAKLFKNALLTLSSGRECLIAFTKKMNSKICFYIQNISVLKFKEIEPIKIEINQELQLHLFQNISQKSIIEYRSNHPEIVKIDANGKITALRPGNAIITASGLNYKSCQVKVLAISYKGFICQNTLNLQNASEYKNIMIVAHPDDETIWGGNNLFKDSYFVVCLTNGYNVIRSNEFKKLLKFTNNSGIILNYPDSQDGIKDDWSEVKIGILKDLLTILNYKNWNKIVTYGPDGTYGHTHHLKTYEYVTKVTKLLNKYNNLYYFAKYYSKKEIPINLPRISDDELKIKLREISLYKSTIKGLYEGLFHILPYENLILASKFRQIK